MSGAQRKRPVSDSGSERFARVGSGRRAASAHGPSSADELLALALELPVDSGARTVARVAVDRLHQLVPDLAVGTCITNMHGGGQIVEVRLPAEPDGDLGRDPTRLFPRMRNERVVAIRDHTNGSTLHVAGDESSLEDDASPLSRFVDCAGKVIGSAMRNANAFERVRASGGDVERLRQQLIQAEKLASLGQIVAGVVHELNNPLTSIVAYSDYLRKKAERAGADSDDVDRLGRIGEAAERILKFARDLIAYARPAHDVPGPVPLNEIIDKALVFCEHELADSRVEVARSFSATAPVRGISGQLTQVFVNLFTNASHAMADTGGTLLVATSIDAGSDWLCVEVTDNGVGIAADVLERVFEPFFTTKDEGRGTGLGLSIAHEIIASHGGELSVKSSLGEGTTFSILLPLAARPPSSKP